jgi:hypothetical protein
MSDGDRSAPSSLVVPTVGTVLASYLANFEARRANTGVTFANAEADALVAVVNAELGNRVEGAVARALATEQVHEHAARALSGEPGLAANVAGYALAVAAQGGLHVDAHIDLIPRAVDLGTAPVSGSALWFWWGWRVRFLAVAGRLVGEDRADRVEEELQLHAAHLAGRCEQLSADPTDVGLCARLAWFAAAPGAGGDALGSAQQLVAAIDARNAGLAVPGADGACEQPARTIELMWLTLAERATGHDERAEEIVAWVLANRSDKGRSLLRAGSADLERLETNPWIALSLACESGPDIAALERRLDPQVPPLPDFAIGQIATDPDGISYELLLDGIETARRVDARELNLLASTVLHRINEGMVNEAGTARQHGHLLMALLALRERSADDYTTASIDHRIAASVAEVLDSQLASGGWAYGQSDVPTTVYRPQGKTTSEFPDRAYAIDAAVPGTALCECFLRTGDERCRAAALQAVAFFEQSLSRVDWQGRPIWTLYPDDERTPRMGSAVNYELWAGCFFAHIAHISEDDELSERSRRYAAEAVAYTAALTDERGNIAYGDYVREMRTPYAAWDAWLLAQIADLTENSAAAELASRIVGRVAELLLPSGAMPNVADYEERMGDGRRWTVHRHGIGPFPVRNRYQLYYVIAAAAAAAAAAPSAAAAAPSAAAAAPSAATGAAPSAATDAPPAARTATDAGLAALGFVLTDLWDEPFASTGTGYNGDGRFTDVPGLRGEQPWILNALAVVSRLGEFDYRVALGDVRAADERVLLAVDRCWQAQRAREQVRGGLEASDAIGILADRATGCAALYRRLRAERWLQDSAIAADLLLDCQDDEGWWVGPGGGPSVERTAVAGLALLDAAEVTRDGRLPEAAVPAATWLAEVVGAEGAAEDVPFAALGRIAVLLTRVDEAPAGSDEVAGRCVSAVLAAQDGSGLWPFSPRRRVLDERMIDILGRLTDLAWGPLGTPLVDRALRLGIDAAWTRLFRPNGRRFATPKRESPMSAAWGIAYATTCCEGAARFADTSLLDRAAIVLRYALHGDRTADGDLRPDRNAPTALDCSARCFSELASILERAPDVAAI